MADAPSSPASSTASQKFEVKRLLSRPADPASSSPRPLTTFGTSNYSTENVPIVPLASLKRSNSFGKSLLKRRPSRTQVDDDPATPKQRTAPLAVLMPSYALPDAVIPNTTPASAYARAYAQRTNMATIQPRSRRPSEPESSRPRPRRPSQPHPFEGVTGRVVAVGDPTDESLALTGLALAGFGGSVKKTVETEGFRSGLTRKVSARFRRRKNSNAGVMSDVEGEVISRKGKEPEKDIGQEAWSREKERAVLRGMGLRPGGSRTADTSDATIRLGRMNRRLSRHLSIEDFRGLVQVEKEMGASFEMWSPNRAGKGRDTAKSPERGRERDKEEEKAARKRAESVSRRTRHDPAIAREREREEKRLAAAVASKMGPADPPRMDGSNTSSRTDSSPITSRSEELPARKDDCLVSRRDDKRATTTRSNSTPSPEQVMSPESNKGGKIWRLVKKMSTGTLKEKKHYPTEKAPPVPALPNSRRSSVLDYGDEVRPELARFGTSRSSIGRNTYYEPGSAAVSIHSGPSSLSGHTTISQPQPQPQPQSQPPTQRHRTASSSRPSMTNDSSAASTSPKSSFGRTQSPRTSMSSYVDLGDEVIPPLPLGKHIVSPGELAQQYSPASRERVSEPASVAASLSLPPPKRPRAAQKPRDKPLTSPSVDSPTKPRSVSDAPVRTKSKPNVLRRPTRLASDGLDVPSPGCSPRSPRSASMTMPSPRPRAPPTLEEPLPTPRPRSNSLGTVFAFREMEGKSRLTEQEKVAKFEQLLEASDKAGGTLHARVQDRLMSDSMRLSGNFDASSVGGL